MTRILSILFITALLVSADGPGYKVKVAGEMRRIMQQGDLSAVIRLDTIRTGGHLFGLGPVAALKGEIIALYGTTYVSEIVADKIVTSKRPNAEASMFVYATVEAWDSKPVADEVGDMQSLERSIESIAQRTGLDLSQPLPFMIRTSKGVFSYHVIDWKDGTVHTMASHKQFAKAGTIINEEVTILGFFQASIRALSPHIPQKFMPIYLEVTTFWLATLMTSRCWRNFNSAFQSKSPIELRITEGCDDENQYAA